jgi:transposase
MILNCPQKVGRFFGGIFVKYSEKTKLSATKDYCSGHDGLKRVAERHRVDVSSLRRWIAAYQAHGEEGLQRRTSCARYSVKFKRAVVKRMRKEGLSFRQVAALSNVRNFNIIGVWEQQYDDGSLAEGRSRPATSTVRMSKKPISKKKPPADADRSHEDLLAEVKHLRMETEYLKKLNALVQANAKAARQKKRKSCLS